VDALEIGVRPSIVLSRRTITARLTLVAASGTDGSVEGYRYTTPAHMVW
jgi:hypothetical protein